MPSAMTTPVCPSTISPAATARAMPGPPVTGAVVAEADPGAVVVQYRGAAPAERHRGGDHVVGDAVAVERRGGDAKGVPATP